MTDRELMQQALEALEVMRPACFAENTLKTADTAITALRDRLAQPEQELVIDCPRCGHCCPQSNQEPVAYTTGHCKQRAQPGGCQLHNVHCGYPDCDRKAVTTPPPPQRQWVGLTPEEVKEISFANRPYVVDMVVALEARLKEKNCG